MLELTLQDDGSRHERGRSPPEAPVGSAPNLGDHHRPSQLSLVERGQHWIPPCEPYPRPV